MKPVNRILLAFKDWEDRKQEMQPALKGTDERTLLKLQLQHLQQTNHRLRNTARPDEQPFMALLHNHISKLEKKLYPNLLQRMLMRAKDRFVDGPAYLQQQAQQRSANIEALKEQLRETGLSRIAGKLEDHLNADHKKAVLPLDCQLGIDKRLNLDVHFQKDVYGNFQLHRLDGTLLEKCESRYQQFDLANWPGLQANHIHSLLEGRAVNQNYTDATGHHNQRWVELGADGPKYYASDHFDLRETLNAFPQLTRNREELVKYLAYGMNISSHWKQEGQFQKVNLQADPANLSIKLFDERGNGITTEQLCAKAKQLATPKKQALEQTPHHEIRNGHKLSA